MKRFFATLPLMASMLLAQQTPNLKLNLPPTGQQNWGPSVNRNFTVIDTAVGALQNAYQGAWVSTVPYSQGQIVTFGGSAYMSLVIGNVNHQPDASPTQWGILSAAGSTVPAPGTTGNAPVSNGAIYTSQLVLLAAARAAANGVASLDSTSHIPLGQIPAITIINGTTVPASSSADLFFGTTAAGVGAFISMPNCPNDGAHAVTYSTTSHSFNCTAVTGGGGGSPPAGNPQDVQAHGTGSTFAADSGIFTYDNVNHLLRARVLAADTASSALTLGSSAIFSKNNNVVGSTSTGGGESYWQSLRTPGGGLAVVPRALNIAIQGGYENENNINVELEADEINYVQQSSGQAGGVLSRKIISAAPGDLVYENLIMAATGCNRGTDECNEMWRKFWGFLNPNFGGHVVKATTFSTGDQPLQFTAGFNGYTTSYPGVDMVLVDATKKVAGGNVIGAALSDSNTTVTLTLDTPHSLGTSTKTTLTHAIDSDVYTGVCPTVTDTGAKFPTTGPNAGVGDAFTVQENGLGLGTINGNYLNDTSNTLVGFCLRFNAVSAAPAPGTKLYISDATMTGEYVTVIASGTTWATAFVHHQHVVGAIVAWGGGVGQGWGMTADELPAGSGFSFAGEMPQTSISKVVYPIAYTPDSTHVVIHEGAEATATAEWRTRAFPNVTPTLPITVTLTRSGSTISFASISANNLQVNPTFAGTSNILPPPSYTVSGCTTPPVLKFVANHETSLTYTVQLVSGGSGCTGTPTVTILPTPNPGYFAPVSWIRSVIDTSNCTNFITANPCSTNDGYVLADSGAQSFSNGDEVLEVLNTGRWMGDQVIEFGDAITALSGRIGPRHLLTYGWVQSGQALRLETNATPSEYAYGSFANGWTPDPTIPGSGQWIPGPRLEIAGIGSTEVDDMPPTGGAFGGAFDTIQPGALNLGIYKYTIRCVLSPTQNNFDHPCLHGQLFPYGFVQNQVGPNTSGIYVTPADGIWHASRGLQGDLGLFGPLVGLDTSFGLQNKNGFTVGSATSTKDVFDDSAKMSAGEYHAGLLQAGASQYSTILLTSWLGAIGSTSYSYAVTSVTNEGEGLPLTLTQPGGPASLDPVTNFIIIKGNFNAGAQSGKVYRTAGPGGVGLICTFVNGPGLPQCMDTGQAANVSAQPPTTDTSGSLIVSGSQKMKGVEGTGSLLLSWIGPHTTSDIVTVDSNGTSHDSGINISAIGGGGALVNPVPVPAGGAEWPMLDGTGTTITDISGNGNNATFGSPAPSWLTYGLAFNNTGFNAGGGAVVNTSITSLGSFVVGHCTPNMGNTSGFTLNLAPVTQFQTFIGSNDTVTGLLIDGSGNHGESTQVAIAPSIISLTGSFTILSDTPQSLTGGCHVYGWTISSPTDSLDHFMYDGQEVTNYGAQGNSSANSNVTGGHFYRLGEDPFGNGLRGAMLYGISYPLVSGHGLTVAQMQKVSAFVQQKLALRADLPRYPNLPNTVTPQLPFVGDSLTAGLAGSSAWTSAVTPNLSYAITNYGIAGLSAMDACKLSDQRWAASVVPNQTTIHFMAGTNDPIFAASPALAWKAMAECASKAKKLGARTIVATIPDRVTASAYKNSYNALIRAQWKQVGFDYLEDVAAVPGLGADGANTNTACFQTDGTHLTGPGAGTCGTIGTTALSGYGILAALATASINTLDGSSEQNPDHSTSNALTLTYANNFMIHAPTANATVALTDCQGLTTPRTIVNNSAFTDTVSAVNSTVVGTAVISANTPGVFLPVLTGPTTGGCSWLRTR